jgi:hypothetical protein
MAATLSVALGFQPIRPAPNATRPTMRKATAQRERYLMPHKSSDNAASWGKCVWCGKPSNTSDRQCSAPDGDGHLFKQNNSGNAAATPSVRLIIETSKHEVKSLSLFDAVSRYTVLKRSGSQFKGLSPFTLEKTASFFVHPTKLGGVWKCFSTGEGGQGVESFLERAEATASSRIPAPPLQPITGDRGEDEIPF